MSYTKQHEADSYRAHAAWIEDNTTQIQRRPKFNSEDNNWIDCFEPSWNHDTLLYRIKPAPKFRPWTADEVPKEPFFVRGKNSGGLVAVSTEACATFHLDRDSLFRNYTKLDGSPCGVEVKEGE